MGVLLVHSMLRAVYNSGLINTPSFNHDLCTLKKHGCEQEINNQAHSGAGGPLGSSPGRVG